MGKSEKWGIDGVASHHIKQKTFLFSYIEIRNFAKMLEA